MISIKKALFSNVFLKTFSFIIGFILWTILNDIIITKKWFTAPLYFYNERPNVQIDAPTSIEIELKGKKSILSKIKQEELGIHIDLVTLNSGTNPYTISKRNLLLPPSLQLTDYKPRNLQIILTEKKV